MRQCHKQGIIPAKSLGWQYNCHPNTVFLTVACVLLLLPFVGCSSDGRMAASGTVTLDGKPLETGTITFQPAPGSEGHSGGGLIQGGTFHLPADHGLTPGKYHVTIQSFTLTGRTVESPLGKVPERLAVRFNEAGKLDATVAASTAGRLDFQLTSAGDESR